VFLPKDVPWLHEFKVEVMALPNGKHDDQIDSLSQFMSWIGNRQWRRRERIRPQTVNRPLGPPLRPR
jgi:phage terminase large subunit-like protein